MRNKRHEITKREELEIQASLAIYLHDMKYLQRNPDHCINIEETMVEAIVDGHRLVQLSLEEDDE